MASDRSLALREDLEIQPQGNGVLTALSGLTVPDERTVAKLAYRLVDHWAGKITGGFQRVTSAEHEAAKESGFPSTWRGTFDRDGNKIFVKPPKGKFDKGELLFHDAVYIIEKYLPMLVNPLASVSLWYQWNDDRTSVSLTDHLDYAVKIGWAESQVDFVTEIIEMSPDERDRNGLKDGDLGMIAYMILSEDKKDWRAETLDLVKKGIPINEAKRLTLDMFSKARGIGVLSGNEMKSRKYPPQGRSWDWLCRKRALTDMVQLGVGKMTPAQIARQMTAQGNALQASDIPALLEPGYPSDAPPEVQAEYIEMYHRAEDIKENPNPDWQDNVDAMRGTNGDDDPLDLAPDDLEGDPEVAPDSEDIDTKESSQPEKAKSDNGGKGKIANDTSTQFWLYVQEKKIDRQAALGIIGEFGGDMVKAFEKLQNTPELIPPDEA